MFLVPTSGIADWKKLLADPEKHWREGYSAHALAARWEGIDGFPPEIAALFATHPAFVDMQLLIGIPEHKVALPGGSRASQTDLWVLGRTRDALVSVAVEGKVRESFGPTLAEWMTDETAGKTARWSALCDLLGLSEGCDRALRYQLVHRTASAVLEAQRSSPAKLSSWFIRSAGNRMASPISRHSHGSSAPLSRVRVSWCRRVTRPVSSCSSVGRRDPWPSNLQ